LISFPNNTILIQRVSELPHSRDREIALDLETTSGDPKISSVNPWHNCSVLGICICDSSNSPGYYIPVGHHNPTPNEPNLPLGPVTEWLREVLSHCDVLVGHNIKYDAHVLQNCLGLSCSHLTLYDTLTQAKIIDSDRLSYSLDILSRDWLGENITRYEAAFAPYLFDGRGNRINQDYGAIPAIVMGPYGGQDVLTTRLLKRLIEAKRPEQCNLVSGNEIKLTSVLLDIERTGLRVDPNKVVLKQVETNWRLIEIIYRIRELTGCEIRPNTTDDCHRFLCGQYGLPILKWTNEDDDSKASNPCFDKYAMKSYLRHPKVQEDAVLFECVKLIQEYRTLDTFNSLFLNTFDNRNIKGILHSTYNQCVRTARLSCSDPNAQQMSDLAKELIETPGPDWVLVDLDLSQIEFRLIASALNNEAVISRYNTDPSTDYHSFVAELAGIDRGPAKNLNFAVGFAAGRKKAIQMVKGSLDITSVGYKESGMHFDTYCQMRAESMYDSYHKMLPELKPTIRQAEQISKKYGYIANLYGRHRRLPYGASYKAFNAYIQSSAADLAKDLTLQITELLYSVADWSELVKLVAVVHDSWIFYMHKSCYIQVCNEITRLIERVQPPNIVRVPIRSSCKVSRTNWADALLTLSTQVIY
jgi:DNA polymerase-1